MKYHLWDVEAGSFIGQYTDEQAALATVKSLVDRYGTTYADELSLGRERDDGTILAPLTGAELVAQLVAAPDQTEERRPRVIGSVRRFPSELGLAAKSSAGRAVNCIARGRDAMPTARRRDSGGPVRKRG